VPRRLPEKPAEKRDSDSEETSAREDDGPDDEEREGEHRGDPRREPGGARSASVDAPEHGTKHASSVERIGGKEIEKGETCVHERDESHKGGRWSGGRLAKQSEREREDQRQADARGRTGDGDAEILGRMRGFPGDRDRAPEEIESDAGLPEVGAAGRDRVGDLVHENRSGERPREGGGDDPPGQPGVIGKKKGNKRSPQRDRDDHGHEDSARVDLDRNSEIASRRKRGLAEKARGEMGK
jgi:hypothetical protein